jgi:hypothetical protein
MVEMGLCLFCLRPAVQGKAKHQQEKQKFSRWLHIDCFSL